MSIRTLAGAGLVLIGVAVITRRTSREKKTFDFYPLNSWPSSYIYSPVALHKFFIPVRKLSFDPKREAEMNPDFNVIVAFWMWFFGKK